VSDLTKDELDRMYEGSKDDNYIIVGSEVRQLVGMIQRSADAVFQAKVDDAYILADYIARIEALEAALEAYEAAIDEAEAIFGGEYADKYGPMFELAMKARDARRAALAPEQDK
jgi:hypothetical protein